MTNSGKGIETEKKTERDRQIGTKEARQKKRESSREVEADVCW